MYLFYQVSKQIKEKREKKKIIISAVKKLLAVCLCLDKFAYQSFTYVHVFGNAFEFNSEVKLLRHFERKYFFFKFTKKRIQMKQVLKLLISDTLFCIFSLFSVLNEIDTIC